MYGWQDFDQAVVANLRMGPRSGVNDDHGMVCPLIGHAGHWLDWETSRAGGSASHGNPPARFRASPTFILDDPLENLIVGRTLVSQLVKMGKAESRVGYETSEDAVSWNVFRSLQEAGLLAAAVNVLIGMQPQSEPELFMWSLQIRDKPDQLTPWPRLQKVRALLEPGTGQKTEPDICLHIDGWGWIFIEAKFGSGTTLCKNDTRLAHWKARYGPLGLGIFDTAAVKVAKRTQLPEQLLRNVLFAHHIPEPNEHAIVVALTRDGRPDPTSLTNPLIADTTVPVYHRTWEQLYHQLCLQKTRSTAFAPTTSTKASGYDRHSPLSVALGTRCLLSIRDADHAPAQGHRRRTLYHPRRRIGHSRPPTRGRDNRSPRSRSAQAVGRGCPTSPA